MKENDFLFFKEWFSKYVSDFYSDDEFVNENIRLKEEHSIRVCENASLIALAENLDDANIYLAKTIALFHDIGRFEQFRKYRTFRDSDSENHALLGVKVLREENVLSILPGSEQKIILAAIANHNKRILPDIADKEILFHSQIIRDADKLDIYKILTDYFEVRKKSPNPALELELPDTPGYSSDLVGELFENRVAVMKNIKTCNDMNLARLAWVFDMNFAETLRLVREQKYIDKFISTLPQTEEIKMLEKHLESVIDAILEREET
ncbi:MAG: HD domain-containing protein [Methanolobus sp.]